MTNGLVFLISTLFSLYIYVVLLRILLELVRADYYHPICQFVLKLTDKPVAILQKGLPRLRSFDLPALLLIVIVELIKLALLALLAGISMSIASFCILLVAQLVDQLLSLFIFLIIVFAVLSWIPNANTAALLSVLHKLLEPILKPIRQFVPLIGGIDLSPLIALLIIYFIRIAVLAPIMSKSLALG